MVRHELEAKKVGLTVGIFFAMLHLVWALIVAFGFGEAFIGFAVSLHFMSESYSVMEFTVGNAIFLIALAFVSGYVLGWIFAKIWNWVDKK